MISRREFLKLSAAASAGILVSNKRLGRLGGGARRALAATQGPGLSDPAIQPKFQTYVPNALDPGFIYDTSKGKIKVAVGQTVQMTGLVAPDGVTPVPTTVWGYGDDKLYTWPGRTFQVRSYEPLEVKWENRLNNLPYLLTGKDNTSLGHGDYTGRSVVDTNLHWAYALHGYEDYTIEKDGTPIVAHLHGGHTDYQFDGNPEFFFSPKYTIRGPQWVDKKYLYKNDQGAGTLWYHDHALGITRLNVYTGMAGFYIVRDDVDTGLPDNPLGLPAYPYELAYAIQDRMFKNNGELFYPAFPGDPFYEGFITEEGATLPPAAFPGGGPTALAEFFGDHMVVNGKIWPKTDVEPRHYRMRLLNGTDSRFMVLRFRVIAPSATVNPQVETGFTYANDPIANPLTFWVIGSDQGLAGSATEAETLVFEPGSRYDVVFDFSKVPAGSRVIVENIGGDEPFGGDIPGPQVFEYTDRVMAFDVVEPLSGVPDNFDPYLVAEYGGNTLGVTRTRKVALFEGLDEYDRLQPLLGTAEPATDYAGNPINWPDTPEYQAVGLTGQMEGAIGWHSPTTENPALGSTEIWEIYNATGDAHPVHLHLVNFEILDRKEFTADVVSQPIVQHNGAVGQGFRLENIVDGATVPPLDGYTENAPKDMVTALPGQVTRIKATFDKPGRYVWHCHILSHEDHEMMRVLHVGPGA